VAARWRELAARKGLSLREVVIEVTSRASFVGSPATVAEAIDRYVQADAADGYILVPHLTPHGLDRFVDEVGGQEHLLDHYEINDVTVVANALRLLSEPDPTGGNLSEHAAVPGV